MEIEEIKPVSGSDCGIVGVEVKSNYDNVDSVWKNTIHETFEALLRMKGMNKNQMSNEMGVDRPYISRIAHGHQIPPTKFKIRVAQFFGVDSRVIWP